KKLKSVDTRQAACKDGLSSILRRIAQFTSLQYHSQYPMRFTPDTRSNHLTLDAALARLAASGRVDGLALFGSRAVSTSEAGDHDLLILVNSLPVGIFEMLTHIGGVLADVVFVTTAMADR